MRQPVGIVAIACSIAAALTLAGARLHGAQVPPVAQGSSIQGFAESLAMIRDLLRQSRFTEAGNVARALLARVESTKGTDALEVAQVLDLLCEASRRKPAGGEDPASLAERAVAIKERALGPNHPEVATSLMNVAVGRALAGDPVGARPIVERALAIREASLGPDDPLVAASLESLAGLLMQLQDDDDAKRCIDRVLRIREKAYGADHAATVRTLLNAGIYYAGTNDYAGARGLFERARAVAERDEERHHLLTFASLTGLAVVAGTIGDYAEAARLDRELLLNVEASYGPADPRVRFPLDSLAQDLRDLGDYSEARRVAARSLEISERTFGSSHPAVAKSLHTLATVVAEMGDYAGAMQLLERATRISEQQQVDPPGNPNGPLIDVLRASGATELDAQLLVNLIAFREGRYGPARPAVGDTLGDLAALLSTDEDYGRTRPLFEQALAARERALGPDHPEVATIATHLADLLLQGGDDGSAGRLYERALRIRERSLGADHPKVAAALASLARLQLREGRYAEARPLLARARGIQETRLGPDHPELGATLASLAELDARTGASRQAFETAVRAEEIRLAHLRLIARALPERQALAYAASGASSLDVLMSVVSTNPGDSQMTTTAWNAVIRGRGLVLDEMAARHGAASAAADQAAAVAAITLASARQRLAALVMRGIRDDTPERYQHLLEQARRDKDRAELDLATISAPFRQDEFSGGPGLEQVSAALPPESALVAFVNYRDLHLDGPRSDASRNHGEPSYIAFLLRRGDSRPAVVRLGTAARIDGLIVRWRRDLEAQALAPAWTRTADEAAYRRVGEELRQQIWDPFVPFLSKISRVLVVPDGAIHLVSVAALPTRASRYLAESGPLIHYVSAERDVVRMQAGRPTRVGLLALGGAAFDEPGVAQGSVPATQRGPRAFCSDFQSMRFGPLPASLTEVDQVVAVWNRAHDNNARPLLSGMVTPSAPGTERLTGRAASASAFKVEAGTHQVLHVATHGFFLGGHCASALDPPPASAPLQASARIARENPLLMSGLAFAGANKRQSARGSEDDGILTAEEIASLDLHGVEWAVLSACDTGVGEIKAGEGVFGLRRAFQVAGARTVIMSLWSVEDRATRDWMAALYRERFANGLTTADAVHAASLDVLRRRRAAGQSAHPFYWAGFVASGDWR